MERRLAAILATDVVDLAPPIVSELVPASESALISSREITDADRPRWDYGTVCPPVTNISEIDLESWQVRREFLTQDGPEHIVLSPDGDTLYVCNGRAGTVSEITVRSGVVTATHEIGQALHGLDLSNDGRTLFVAAHRQNKVLSIDLNSNQLRSAVLPSAPYHLSTIKRAGKLYISSATEPVIWVMRQQNLDLLRTIRINGIGHQIIFVPPT